MSPLGFKARVGSLIRTWQRHTITPSLRLTSDATPADLSVASMVAKPSLPHTCEALAGLETGSYHAAAHSVRSGSRRNLPLKGPCSDSRGPSYGHRSDSVLRHGTDET